MNYHEQEKDDIDFSEEAIPERDPAYRLPGGTLSDTQTVEHLPVARRLVLAPLYPGDNSA